jgi:hypothetical protein
VQPRKGANTRFSPYTNRQIALDHRIEKTTHAESAPRGGQ